MNDNIVMRYLHSLVKNKRISSSLWLKRNQFTPHTQKYGDVIIELLEQGSEMTPDIVHAKLSDKVGEEDASAFMDAVSRCDVTPAQTRELHSYILSDFISNRAKTILVDLTLNMKRPGAIDSALEELRGLKAMQPSKQASLGGQMAGAIKEAFNGDKNLIKYGYRNMDRRLGGGTRGEITLIAARPGHGKTSFAVQLLLNWSKMGYKTIFFSLEMPTGKLIHKMMSNQARVPGQNLRTGKMSDGEKERLTKTAEEFVMKFKDSLLIYDDVYSVREMETIVAKHRPDVFVVDFIQLVQMDTNNPRTEIFKIMSSLKRMAKEYNLNVVVLSQLNRSVENREDPVPRLSDLAESGSLEQLSADVAFLWYAHKMDDTKPRNLVEVYFQKTRYGELSKFEMLFDGSVMAYSERAHDMRQVDIEEQIEQQREAAAHGELGQQNRPEGEAVG